MCGLWGIAGDLSPGTDKDVAKLLALFSTTRGEDSSGVAIVKRDPGEEPDIIKCVGHPYGIFESSRWDKTTAFATRAFIGHARKATIGGISRKTAHPFQYGALTGVHNGTLKNWRYLPGTSEDTDSMTLYEVGSRLGMREAIEQTEGAYALVWWDNDEQTLNITRNNERTLYYAFSDDGKRMFWASEFWMLNIALAKCAVKLMDLTPNDPDKTTHILPVEEDRHFKIKIGLGKEALRFLGEENQPVGWELKGGVRPAKYVQQNFRTTTSTYTPGSGSGGSRDGRVPFPWEAAGTVSGNAKPGPQPALPAPTANPGASASTSASTSTSQQTEQTSRDSRSPRPTLSLVHVNRSDGSTPSTQSTGSPSDVSEAIVAYAGNLYDKQDFELTEQKCCFCDVDITWEDAQNGKTIAKWLDETTMICAPCLKQVS